MKGSSRRLYGFIMLCNVRKKIIKLIEQLSTNFAWHHEFLLSVSDQQMKFKLVFKDFSRADAAFH